MKKNRLFNRHQYGIGLLEILISILVGSILVLAITTMYGNFISASKLQKQQSYTQDQANFAFLTLNRAIRMSGAGLCVKPTASPSYFHQEQEFDPFPPLLSGAKKLDSSSRLHSYSNPSASNLDTSLVPMPNSDALLVIYSDVQTRRISSIDLPSGATAQEGSRFHPRKLDAPRSKNDAPVFYYNGDDIQPTWVMISDCEHTGVLKYVETDFPPTIAADILPPPATIEQGFLYNFGGNGEEVLLARLHAKLFFVAKPDPQSKISNLYEKDLLAPNNDAKQIAAYVQRMNIEYYGPYKDNDPADPTNTKKIDVIGWMSTAKRDAPENKKSWSKHPDFPVRITLTMNAGNLDDPKDEQNYTRVLSGRN